MTEFGQVWRWVKMLVMVIGPCPAGGYFMVALNEPLTYKYRGMDVYIGLVMESTIAAGEWTRIE